jgi:DNA-binding Lrp family transcriptional regulator
MVKGHENKQISKELRVPLSTIQRRTKNLTDSGVVHTRTVPDFRKLGIKQGLLHIYLTDGNIRQSASQIAKMDGIMSASIHIGDSDVVCGFVYEDSDQLVDIIAAIKHMNNVHKVKWSEEVSELPVNSGNVLSSFKKFWNVNGNNGNNRNSKRQTNRQYSKLKVKEK